MLQRKGDIFKLAVGNTARVLCITTNGSLRQDGLAVMGAGVAQQANQLLSQPGGQRNLQRILGNQIHDHGNHVHDLFDWYSFSSYRVVSFPVKHRWHEPASKLLIERSLDELATLVAAKFAGYQIYLPRPGCGNGQLRWHDVFPLCARLDDHYTIVCRENEV